MTKAKSKKTEVKNNSVKFVIAHHDAKFHTIIMDETFDSLEEANEKIREEGLKGYWAQPK